MCMHVCLQTHTVWFILEDSLKLELEILSFELNFLEVISFEDHLSPQRVKISSLVK